MGALKEEWRKPSSYLSGTVREGWFGVELGRAIAEGELDQSSDSTYCACWRKSGEREEGKEDI